MDQEARQLERRLLATGQLVEAVLTMINNMRERDRDLIYRNLRFLSDRKRVTWTLGSWEDGRRNIAIKFLSDSTIQRIVNTRPCMDKWRAYLKYGDKWEYGEAQVWRSRHDVVIEEAEYRGILNTAQVIWQKFRDNPADLSSLVLSKEFTFAQKCNTRGGHEFTFVGTEHVCINCRLKVNNEKMVDRAHHMLRGRLRLVAC